MTEADLAAKVVNWLSVQGWDVYQEVQLRSGVGRRPDIVAVSGKILWAVECKRSLTFAVVEQAAHVPTHMRSVAVPACDGRSDGRRFACHVCRQNLVGVIEVGYSVQPVVLPPLLRTNHEQAQRIRELLRPEHKTAACAGTNGGGYWTPFRETLAEARRYIESHPGCGTRDLMAALTDCRGHYASEASCRAHLPRALARFAPWCRVEQDGRAFRYYAVG